MLGAIGSAISGALKAAVPYAPLIGAGLSYLGGRERNAASAQAAQQQMAFQREMSDTSYQRQVADLKRAGINPMLVSKLGGASTPSGAMPTFFNPYAEAASSFSALQSSSAAKQQAETQENLSASQIKQVDAAADKIRAEIENIPTEGERLKAMVGMLIEQAKLLEQQKYTSVAQAQMLTATMNKIILETDLVRGSVQAMKDLDNIGKNFEAAKPIVDVLKGILGRR